MHVCVCIKTYCLMYHDDAAISSATSVPFATSAAAAAASAAATAAAVALACVSCDRGMISLHGAWQGPLIPAGVFGKVAAL